MSRCQGLKVVGSSAIKVTAQPVLGDHGVVWSSEYGGSILINIYVKIDKTLWKFSKGSISCYNNFKNKKF